MSSDHKSTLSAILDAARNGKSKASLTVLSPQVDPYRMDIPRRQREGEWLGEIVEQIPREKIHLRGVHYVIVTLGALKPDGEPYRNTEEDWLWLQDDASKSARWLGYVPFDKIIDKKNAQPTVKVFERPRPYSEIDLAVEIPDANDRPRPWLLGYRGIQPYRFALFGEKSSLDEVLDPIAEQYGADLYLPTGEASDTMVYTMAKAASDDGRPLVIFYFADCDPGGYEMSANVGRKLQALEALEFPGLEFEICPVALSPDQVREYELPVSPLKESEKRAPKWIAATGVEQTEIDSIATLKPELLAELAHEAISPYWDADLAGEVAEAEREWRAEAEQAMIDQVGEDEVERVREEVENRLAEAKALVTELDDAVTLPDEPEILYGEADGERVPLLSSEWDYIKATRALQARKRFED